MQWTLDSSRLSEKLSTAYSSLVEKLNVRKPPLLGPAKQIFTTQTIRHYQRLMLETALLRSANE